MTAQSLKFHLQNLLFSKFTCLLLNLLIMEVEGRPNPPGAPAAPDPIYYRHPPPPPPLSHGKCHSVFCFIYESIRCCCCLFGCCCSAFWVLLLWALISLSTVEFDATARPIDQWEKATDTCYHTLHVTPEATQKEIQKSFRKLALKYHPDKAAAEDRLENEKIFQEISHCYDILGDEDSRKRYDAAGFRETNADGMPFDGDVTLHDIWTFFYEAWKEADSNEDVYEEDHYREHQWDGQQSQSKERHRRKQRKKRSSSKKRKQQKNDL